MEASRLLAQRIKGVLDVAGTGATTLLECLEVMRGIANQLAAVIAARMTGNLLSLIKHACLHLVGTQRHRLADHLRRHRIPIAVEPPAGMGIDAYRTDF